MTGEKTVRKALLKAKAEFAKATADLEDAIFNYQYPSDETPEERELEYQYIVNTLNALENDLNGRIIYLDKVRHASAYTEQEQVKLHEF